MACALWRTEDITEDDLRKSDLALNGGVMSFSVGITNMVAYLSAVPGEVKINCGQHYHNREPRIRCTQCKCSLTVASPPGGRNLISSISLFCFRWNRCSNGSRSEAAKDEC